MRLASGTGNPGSSRTPPELVCCEAMIILDNTEISECHKWLQKQTFRVYNPSSVKTVKLDPCHRQTHETKVVTNCTLYVTNSQKLCNTYSLTYLAWIEDDISRNNNLNTDTGRFSMMCTVLQSFYSLDLTLVLARPQMY